MNHPVLTYLRTFAPFSNQEWEHIAPHLSLLEVKKGTCLLAEGQVCRQLYFLESGLMRFYIDRDGVDVSKFFTFPPYYFTSQRSFTVEEPAQESIEALEDSRIWGLNRSVVYELFELDTWQVFIRELTQMVQYNTEQILQDLQTKTAENRYLELLKTADPILQQVPLKHLASYLGIAPQSLSRIRKKYASKLQT